MHFVFVVLFGPLNTQHFVLNILLSINMNLVTSHFSTCCIPICFKNLGDFGTYFLGVNLKWVFSIIMLRIYLL